MKIMGWDNWTRGGRASAAGYRGAMLPALPGNRPPLQPGLVSVLRAASAPPARQTQRAGRRARPCSEALNQPRGGQQGGGCALRSCHRHARGGDTLCPLSPGSVQPWWARARCGHRLLLSDFFGVKWGPPPRVRRAGCVPEVVARALSYRGFLRLIIRKISVLEAVFKIGQNPSCSSTDPSCLKTADTEGTFPRRAPAGRGLLQRPPFQPPCGF